MHNKILKFKIQKGKEVGWSTNYSSGLPKDLRNDLFRCILLSSY